MYAQTNKIELRVLVKGKPITNYMHNGKNFVEGRSGSKFEIEIINRNPFKVEAVVSVDGTSVIDGKAAGEHSPGYLVEANSSVKIPGWKVNSDVAAAFEFTGKDNSYTTEMTGSSANNGVIGVMAFKDRNYRPVEFYAKAVPFRGIMPQAGGGAIWNSTTSTYGDTQPTLSSLEPYAVASASMASETRAETLNNLGTGFGQATEFKTETVSFSRGDLQAVIAVFYDNARGLKARGIDVGRKSRVRHTATEPQAFPAMNCPVPRNWKG